MDPGKRSISVVGFLTGTLAGGEDELIAIAKGAKTTFKNRKVEDRATIRGGLLALQEAGLSKVGPKGLQSKIFQSKEADARLAKAAGGGDLKTAATRMRARVAKHGPGLARAAWGARTLFLLENLKGFQKVRGAAAGVSSIFGPIGMIIGAAVGAHGAISGKVAARLAQAAQGWVQSGLAAYRRNASPPALEQQGEAGAQGSEPVTGPSAFPLPWLVGGAIVALGLLLSRRPAAEAQHA